MNNNPKIFDIRPPGEVEEREAPKKKIPGKKKEGQPPVLVVGERKEEQKPPARRLRLPKKILFVFLVIIVAFVLVSQFVLNKTQILIYPSTQNATLSGKVTANTTAAAVDTSLGVIPGKIFETNKTYSQDFTASGVTNQGQKAQGEITIYNDYSTAPQILVATTRFISSGGKLFRTTQKVTVPGGTYVSGKFQPGTITVKVVADQPGDSYNIGPDTFSIPGFAGTAKYTAFYGKSTAAMTGGSLGQVPQVTQDDIDNAKKTLTDKSETDAEDFLKKTISSDFIISDNAVSVNVVGATSSAAAGDTVKNFTYQVQVDVKIFAFKKADLENFSDQSILAEAATGKQIKDGSLQLSWNVDSVDFNGGKMAMDFNSAAVIYTAIDQQALTQSLVGESLSQAQQTLANLPQVDSAQIKSWPFWANGIPKDPKKVQVKLMLD